MAPPDAVALCEKKNTYNLSARSKGRQQSTTSELDFGLTKTVSQLQPAAVIPSTTVLCHEAVQSFPLISFPGPCGFHCKPCLTMLDLFLLSVCPSHIHLSSLRASPSVPGWLFCTDLRLSPYPPSEYQDFSSGIRW